METREVCAPHVPRAQNSTSSARWFALLLVWAAAVGGGGTLLWKYAGTAGVAATPPEQWPTQSAIPREPGHAMIVMMAHPRCPCTRASIAELAQLMGRVEGQARAHVLLIRPPGAEPGWERTDLWRSAAAIPGVRVHADVGGAEAALFQASTSGQTVVYDAAGHLLFRGGITSSRGHEGDNVGRQRIMSLLTRGHADRSDSKVFGCSLDSRAPRSGNGRL
ncbi:MAG TPA: hypothetical protein VK524_27015 [Polyangiaceae bacterium]|nr:hypothetical protein [Polyangiaceae bacterium]